MFEVNEEFDIDADFLDKVFASEKKALEKQTLPILRQLPECHDKQSSCSNINSLKNSVCRPIAKQNLNNQSFSLNNACQPDEGRNHSSTFSNQDNTPKRNITSAERPHVSKCKRQRKFPGPAGLLPDRNQNNSFNMSTDILDLDVSLDTPAKHDLCSQSTLSGSVLEDEPWQNFLSDLGSQQNILKVLNIASIKKKAAARLLTKRKVPFLAAVLHHIDASAPDPCIILRDTTGEIHGTLHRNVWDKFGAELKPGCVLVLKNVGVLSTGISSRRHYLNITGNNLVTLYATSQGKVQVSEGVGMSNLNFLKFIEDWRASVNPTASPMNVQAPSRALSLFNTSLPQSTCSPKLNITTRPTNSAQQTAAFGSMRNTGIYNSVATPSRKLCNSSNLSSTVVQNKLINYNQPIQKPGTNSSNPLSEQNISKQSFINNFQVHQTVKNNISNQTEFSQSDFVSKPSPDMFLSGGVNSITSQRQCNTLEGNENTSKPFNQPKRPTNNVQNIFSFSNANHFGTNENQEMSQSSMVFTRELDEEEKSVVESVFDGFDSEAFFDDF